MYVCIYYISIYIGSPIARVVCDILVIIYMHKLFCRCKNVHSVYCRERVGHSTPSVPSESNPAASAQPQLHICISGSSLELSEPPPWSPPQSSCPLIATTPMMKTLPALHHTAEPSVPIPPSHPASAVSLENHIYSLMLVIGLIDDVLYICSYQMWSSRFKGHGHRRPTSSEEEQEFPSRAHSGLLGSVRTVPWTAEPCGGPVEAPSPVPVWRTCWASTPRRIRAPSGSGPRTAGGSLHDRINNFCNVMQKIERDMSFQSVCRPNHRL